MFSSLSCLYVFLPGGEAAGLMVSSNNIRLGQFVCRLSVRCPFREAASTNLAPNELGMVLNEGEYRKTLLRRCTPRRRCLVLEI